MKSDTVLPIPGLKHADRKATPWCKVCAKPIDWKFEGSELCAKCREKEDG